jgi:hypothetical protein
MLAYSYKTAKELRLSNKQHAALIDVLSLLDDGVLKHVPITTEFVIGGFNMCDYTGDWCDSIHCIAGWADHLHGTRFEKQMRSGRANHALLQLFTVDSYDPDFMETITVEEAATALRNYLTLGKPEWEQVLKPRL